MKCERANGRYTVRQYVLTRSLTPPRPTLQTSQPVSEIPSTAAAAASRIEFATPDDGVIVVRVIGRGSFENSFSLKKIPEVVDAQFGTKGKPRRIVIDLEQCRTIDSTFFGVMASLGLTQIRAQLGKMVLVNVNKHVHNIISVLGLTHVLEIHEAAPPDTVPQSVPDAPAVTSGEFKSVSENPLDKLHRIVVMLEAHQQLVDLNGDNQVRFRNVIDCLEAALDDEKRKGQTS